MICPIFLIFFAFLFPHVFRKFVSAKKCNLNEYNGKEVYATLYSPLAPNPALTNETDYYFEATRILIYRLLHRASTKDLDNRGVIVLATQSVLPEQIRQLRLDGAMVKTVHPTKTDFYTKLLLWNMTEYSKILYLDPYILPLRPLSSIFDTPISADQDGEPYLFAATYDITKVRAAENVRRPISMFRRKKISPYSELHAGLFLLHPSEKQAKYLQSIYENPPEGRDLTIAMDQSLFNYAYRDDGKYHWIRLAQAYNIQWPRLQDMNDSYALYDTFWKDTSPVAWDVRRYWYIAWGQMLGWSQRPRSIDTCEL